MKTDNKYKYIFLTVTMLISSALIVSNTFNIGKRNNEKIYIIGTIILMFCIFLSQAGERIKWSIRNGIVFFIMVAGFVGIANLITLFGINQFTPVFIPVVAVAVLIDFSSGIAFAMFYTTYIYIVIGFGEGDVDYFAGYIRMFLIAMIFVLYSKNLKSYMNIIYNAVLVLCLVTITNIIYFNLPYECVKYDKIFANIFATLLTLVVGFVCLIFRKIIFFDKISIEDLSGIYYDTYEPMAKYKEKAFESYQHAVTVCNLAELVSEGTRANREIVKAGAMYHEIGKSVGKEYVKEGLLICEKYGIPNEVKDIVIEHCLKIRKPRSLESAIVMLSDSIINSINYAEKNKQKINYTYMIENVMKVRFDSGSLCESGMTIEEYSKIKKVFISAYANQVKI